MKGLCRRPPGDEAEAVFPAEAQALPDPSAVPDHEYSKTSVLISLTSLDGQRGYGHAIDEFVDWYSSGYASSSRDHGNASLSFSLGYSHNGQVSDRMILCFPP
jgi:hypothetical protein